jgi:hypothetical protein
MNNQNTVSALGSPLVPFRALAADANFVAVTAGAFGPPPSFNVVFGVYTPTVPATEGTPAVPQKSGPNLPDYVPAQPATPGTPEVPAAFAPHRQETLSLTREEWDNWNNSVSDEAYILGLVAARFGVKLTAGA